ncbi:hypothetical protein F442_19841 [Phytophthora nicotianae P10297]|uniref:RING-type domain-containing protein n=1 Tax=Phytophthora nicotianae P10297 TaxID=1317064 RepID=W2YAR1_PHYNI|nr:hypothetical protein F442_19841 [Phytophthora nicotianae P10297]
MVIATIDLPRSATNPGTPPDIHPDSLLHPQNHRGVKQAKRDLSMARMGGYAVKWTLDEKQVKATIDKLCDNLAGNSAKERRVHDVTQYLADICLKKTNQCKRCLTNRRFLMILPCGHLYCALCVEEIKMK